MLVVKLGGGGELDLGSICEDVAALIKEGEKLVLVHGGSSETNMISEKLGKPPRFVTSPSGFESRYTDRETLEIFAMVVAGKVNKLIVEQLQQVGVNALGLSGLDGRVLEGKRKGTIIALENGKKKVLHGDYGGTVEGVNGPLLRLLLEQGYTPVIAPLAISPEGEALNVDGDRVAAAVAGALRADALIILTGVRGLLANFPNEDSLIPRIPREKAREYLDRYAQGRMKKKLLGAMEALEQSVRSIVIADGRVEHPVLKALEHQGTVIE